MKIDADFAFKIRQALNEGADRLDYKTQLKLENARKAALARFDAKAAATVTAPATQLVLAGASVGRGDGRWEPLGWVHRLGLLAPLLALIVGVAAIQQWREAQRIKDLADIDFAVLLDDVPLEAYADKGFGRFMQQQGQQGAPSARQ